jgi:hypothetical protein
MKTFKVIFSVNEIIHPQTQIVTAIDTEDAVGSIRDLCIGNRLKFKRCIAILELPVNMENLNAQATI